MFETIDIQMAQRFRAMPYNADIRPLAHIRTDISIYLF